MKPQSVNKSNSDASEKLSEQMRKMFRIEAVGLMSLWFSYGTMPMVHIVVEWEIAKGGCTMHVSPDQLWPHTKVHPYLSSCFIIFFTLITLDVYYGSFNIKFITNTSYIFQH
jgi:hypothetical protein